MVRSEAEAQGDASRLPVETAPVLLAPDLASRPDARTTLLEFYRALHDRRIAAASRSEPTLVPVAAAWALLAPGQDALVVLEAVKTSPSWQLVMSVVQVQFAERALGRPLPRTNRERAIDNTYAESLRLSVIAVPDGRVLWTDEHAEEGGGHRPDALERALDTMVARIPRRR